MSLSRPRRSVLYLPGANPRALEKARELPADALILDLEDAVAPDSKPEARDRVVAAVGAGFGPREVSVRCNAIGTPWHDADVAAVARSGADAIVVPKVGDAADVDVVAAALDRAGAPSSLTVWPMVETPRAVLEVASIAAHPRVGVLVLGTNDLAKELRAEHVAGRQPLLGALSSCVLGARAGDAGVLDGVFNDLDDDDGFLAECRQARQLGFDGKTVIHPRQLGPANATWTPDEETVAAARRVVAAWEAAAGSGVVVVDGRMVEHLHVAQARRTLALAEELAGS